MSNRLRISEARDRLYHLHRMLSRGGGGLSVAQIAQRTGYPRSSVQVMLDSHSELFYHIGDKGSFRWFRLEA